jgi:hypothetical protein
MIDIYQQFTGSITIFVFQKFLWLELINGKVAAQNAQKRRCKNAVSRAIFGNLGIRSAAVIVKATHASFKIELQKFVLDIFGGHWPSAHIYLTNVRLRAAC